MGAPQCAACALSTRSRELESQTKRDKQRKRRMKLGLALLCSVYARGGISSGGAQRRKSSAGRKAPSGALTSGYASPNPNVESVNNLVNIGCQMAAIEDEYVMAIGGHYLKKFTNCGRCAQVTCVGNVSKNNQRKLTLTLETYNRACLNEEPRSKRL